MHKKSKSEYNIFNNLKKVEVDNDYDEKIK
jgi:hypothetical protein